MSAARTRSSERSKISKWLFRRLWGLDAYTAFPPAQRSRLRRRRVFT